jgi:hypothetical protein
MGAPFVGFTERYCGAVVPRGPGRRSGATIGALRGGMVAYGHTVSCSTRIAGETPITHFRVLQAPPSTGRQAEHSTFPPALAGKEAKPNRIARAKAIFVEFVMVFSLKQQDRSANRSGFT